MSRLANHKKIVVVALVILLAAGYGVKTYALKPPPPDVSALAKEPGPVYSLGRDFVVNLADSGDGFRRFARVSVALHLSKLSATELPATSEGGTTTDPVLIADDATLRDIVNEVLSTSSSRQLLSAKGRTRAKTRIRRLVNRQTDVRIVDVYFTGLTVQ